MASFDISPGDGVTTHFPITFNYLDRDHVVVEIDGVPTSDFSWFDASTIEFDVAPANGSLVYRRRVTPVDEPMAVYTNGSVLVEDDMNVATLQALFASEEAKDRANQSIILNTESDQYDFDGHRAVNLADPVDDQDAATQSYVKSFYVSVVATLNSIVSAANTTMNTLLTAAESARNAAIMARDTALDYMNSTYAYMQTTLGYRNSAEISATNAYGSELNAAQSALEAATSAASIDGPALLRKDDNLASLTDKAEARDNLGLPITTKAALLADASGGVITDDVAWQAAEWNPQSVSGAVTLDCNTASNFWLTLTGNVTIDLVNHKPGQTIMIVFQQDATGGRTVGWSSKFLFPNNTAPSFGTAATGVSGAASIVPSSNINYVIAVGWKVS